MRRPEIGALLAAIVVAIFFWTQNPLFLQLDGIANWTDVASTIGIPAVVVALLMIGGEFDLSAGVMTGSAGLMIGILATEVGMNIWIAIVLTLIAASGVGFLNGYMVMRTELPSFIVTLATFFVLQGVNLGVTKAITNQVTVCGSTSPRATTAPTRSSAAASGRRTTSRSPCCGGSPSPRSGPGCSPARASATGSSASAATPTPPATSASRSSAVKIRLFMATSFVCALTGIMIALRLASTQATASAAPTIHHHQQHARQGFSSGKA